MINCYILENLTNLHVGSGDINYGVVDNLVQKDPVTKYPVIHSSSLKGSFREYFEKKFKDSEIILYIFGQNPDKSDKKTPGAYSFFEAKMLSRPVRSSEELYFNATTKGILEEFLMMCESLGVEFRFKEDMKKLIQAAEKDEIVANKSVYLEDEKAKGKDFEVSDGFKKFFGENIAIYPDSLFKDLSLPFVARNRLNNGESKNLWYEEIVPRYTKFYFFIQKPDEENVAADEKTLIENFDEEFKNTEIIQIGANKSIGYGFCKLRSCNE